MLKKCKKYSLNVFAGTTHQSKKIEAVEIVVVKEQQHTFSVTGYNFEEKEKLADEELPTVTATVVCSGCGKELSVPATVVGDTDEEGNAVYDVKVTCLVDGERTFIASVEGYEDAESVENSKKYTIAALGHDYQILKKEDGYCSAICTRCNERVSTAHDPDQIEWTPSEGNQHVKKCEICGKVIATGSCNSSLIQTEKVATCTEPGEYSYMDCTVCHRHASEDHTAPAMGHQYVYDTTAEGTEQHKCTRCGEVEACAYDESIAQAQVEPEKDESHIVNGICKICKHQIVLRNEPHEYDERIAQKENDNDNDNHKVVGTCKKCGYTKDLRDEAHNYEYKLSQDQKQHYKQCKDCGYIDESSKADHDYEYTQLEKVGAYDQHKKVCKICGREVKRETCVFNQQITVSGRAATCEEDGFEGYTYKACVCGRPKEEITPKVLPALGHNLTVTAVEGRYQVKCSNQVRPNGSNELCIEYGKQVTVESLSEIINNKAKTIDLSGNDMTIAEDIEIPEGVTLTVKASCKVQAQKIVNNGKLVVESGASLNADVSGTGSFSGDINKK